MKKITLILCTLLTIISCKDETNKTNTVQSPKQERTLLFNFLKNSKSLEVATTKTPLISLQKQAIAAADKIVNLQKANIQEVLKTAKSYKNCIIFTENHTLVKITDNTDCKDSGSWAACMPMAEGYIKKGALVRQDNYLNYSIGVPDSQKRTAYFFN
ncbi:hypothetical protein [Flavicella sediminum]|uniref:hypothetical protein n=1 Tax=Flavicella sediminum TaxID=2585141 RepID=UPI0011233AE1|nr:hypothetical protein [Flavicella sediminum]